MYRSKTVFVVGAGASAEVGLPIGTGLKDQIVSRLKVREDEYGGAMPPNGAVWDVILQHCRNVGFDARTFVPVCQQLCNALPLGPSIDVILQSRDHEERFALCAKAAIAHAILEGERSSALASRRGEQPDILGKSVTSTWYNRLGSSLADGAIKGATLDRIFSNVTFIIFNYDRCVEHYLYWHLRTYFGLNQQDTVEILSNATFYHPYGTVGKLPWQVVGSSSVEFGAELNRFQLLEVVKGLWTFSETLEDNESVEAWRGRLREASNVVFLGFSFIEQNMKLLRCGHMSTVARVYATGFGLSESNRSQASADVRSALQSRTGLSREDIMLRAHKCSELFDEYSLSLTR